MKKQPKTITLDEFAKNLTPEQLRIADEQTRYYFLLTSFKEAREKKGITQQELAEKAQVNRVTLNQIESGLRNATISTLDKLAVALGMRLEVKLRTAY